MNETIQLPIVLPPSIWAVCTFEAFDRLESEGVFVGVVLKKDGRPVAICCRDDDEIVQVLEEQFTACLTAPGEKPDKLDGEPMVPLYTLDVWEEV